jgi:hypothetical protein
MLESQHQADCQLLKPKARPRPRKASKAASPPGKPMPATGDRVILLQQEIRRSLRIPLTMMMSDEPMKKA